MIRKVLMFLYYALLIVLHLFFFVVAFWTHPIFSFLYISFFVLIYLSVILGCMQESDC